MNDVQIKHEDKILQKQCRACLSTGRRLVPLGDYADIYRRIISDHPKLNTIFVDMKICWECQALLRNIMKFQSRVRQAEELLYLGQNFIYSLSSLTTIVFNDTNPNTMYINNALQIDKIHVEDDKTFDNLDNDHIDTEEIYTPKTEDNVCEEKTKVKLNSKPKNNNKWAKKRALQNKKPKFKIVDVDLRKDVSEVFLKSNCKKDLTINKYSCELCTIGFENEEALVNHKKRYNKNQIYICDLCKKIYLQKRHLSTHMSKHYDHYRCDLCEFVGKKEDVYRHFKDHGKVFQCIKCKLRFGGRREFFKHFKEWHEKFTCDHCGITFKMRYCLKDHIRKQHSPFECKQCDKRFARYNGLWLHNKVRHTPATRAAYCVECDKRYADVYRYRWHLANSTRHTPKKRVSVPCPGCEKTFSKNIYMKDHYNLVHLKQYKYRCEACDKNFIRNADLVKHKRRVHEGILPPKNKICYICGRGFSTNKILTNHLRTHTGERPFACSKCPARFAQNTALVGHMRAHHADS